MAEAFFDARPPGGYRTQRVLTPTDVADPDASILRQAIRYHQQEQYDLALVAFRAHFADHPESDEALTISLAASAAMASGVYAEAGSFSRMLPEGNATRLWLQALLALREERRVYASQLLNQLEQTPNNPYPSSDLLLRLSQLSNKGE